MKRSELLKRIIALVYAILLCVTVSFAWILTEEENIVDDVIVGYDDGKLVIASKDIEGKIIIADEQGNETELTEDYFFSPTEILPNSVIAFSLRIKNNAYEEMVVDISMVGISAENVSLLDVVYFSATPSSGWEGETPSSVYVKLGDAALAQDGTYTLNVAAAVRLRSTEPLNEDDYMEYECYFYFDGESMTNVHQNIDLSVGAIRISQR